MVLKMHLTFVKCALLMLVSYNSFSYASGNNNTTTIGPSVTLTLPSATAQHTSRSNTSTTKTLGTTSSSSSSGQKITSITITPTPTPTTPTPTRIWKNTISSTSSTTTNTVTTPNGSEGDAAVIAVGVLAAGVVAAIAAVVALVFVILYLRASNSGCLNISNNRSADAFQFENVRSTSSSPIRTRLASLSSIRRQAICKNDPLSLTDFREHVKRLHADSDYLFSLEYEAVGGKKHLNDIDKKQDLTIHEGKKDDNKAKNRYSDILPYDHSRVVLTEIDNEPGSVYINANYVDSYRKQRAYIAAQGPLTASLGDFWRMIWENNSRVIVMVTNLFERTKSKCVQYWPDKGSKVYGFLTVKLIKEEELAHYVVRTLCVELSSNQDHYITVNDENESRIIQQFQFTEWPDHDVPIHPIALLRFIRFSRSAGSANVGPPVIHCSAGVGRSGVYMVIDSMMERIEDDKTVDVFNFLNHIRTQRMFLVQEESQYIFVHDCILEHINFGDTNIPIKQFHKRLQSLRKVNPETKKSQLRDEFEDIDRTKHPEKHKWAGKKTYNLCKNRRKDILPVERTRVKLPLVLGMDGADYINASFIDGFRKKREYIATQAPMVKTAESFYRMISSTECSIIVMFLDDEQWKKDDFSDLPTEDEAVSCGRFEIHLESQEVSDKFTVRKLRLFSSERSDGHTITHYHYRDWPSGGLPKDKTSLINFIEQVREHKLKQNNDHPITVHCDYGVGPTGVFCLVGTLYDQIEYEKCVDVFQAAKLIRGQRPKLIETEDQYSFCYDLMDQVIARKLVSMTDDSDNDEPNSLGTVVNNVPSTDPDVITSHQPGLNGSVVGKSAGKDSPKIGGTADNASPKPKKMDGSKERNCPSSGVNSPNAGNEMTIMGNDNPGAGRDTPDGDRDSPDATTENAVDGGEPENSKNPMPNTESESSVNTTHENREDVDSSDNEQPDKTSSQQALLSTSDFSL